MDNKEKIIKALKRLSEWLFQQYQIVYDGDAPNYYDAYKTVEDAMALLKEQQETINELEGKLRLLKYGDLDTLQGVMMPAT